MALPKIQDLITYVSKVITGTDWNTNWQTVVSWLSSGSTDLKVKSIELAASGGITNNGSLTQAGNVSIGGNLAVTGSVTGASFAGDGSGLTGIISSASVSYTPFTANSGNVDVNGLGEILYFAGGTGTLNFKVGGTLPAYDSIVSTTAQGVTFTLTQILDLDVSTYDDGTYAVCVKKNQTVAEVRGTIYRQIVTPTGSNGDLWLNTGKEGLVCYEKISGSWSNEYEGVPIGTFTVASGVVTAVTTNEFNYNWYDLNTNYGTRTRVIGWNMVDYSTEVSKSKDTSYTATTDLYAVIRSQAGSASAWGIKITYKSVLYDFSTFEIFNADGSTVPFTIPIPKGATYEFKQCSVMKVYEFLGENNA